MLGVSRSVVGLAGVVLVASAALGFYIGYSRTAATPAGASHDAASSVQTTIAPAKAVTAIPDSAPVAPVPDEAFIRKIAREEVQSALHPKRAAPPPDADDGSNTSQDAEADTHAPPAPVVNVTPTPLAAPTAPQ
jgi:hypothetical protein